MLFKVSVCLGKQLQLDALWIVHGMWLTSITHLLGLGHVFPWSCQSSHLMRWLKSSIFSKHHPLSLTEFPTGENAIISLSKATILQHFIEHVQRKWTPSSKYYIAKISFTYRKVTSSNRYRLEAHAGFFRLPMKGIFDPYVLCPLDKKLIS